MHSLCKTHCSNGFMQDKQAIDENDDLPDDSRHWTGGVLMR